MRGARADVICRRRRPVFERGQGAQVRRGQIADVNVVAQAGAVGGRVILAKHAERRPAGRGANRQRDQVNLVTMIFADRAVGMRPRRIEVTQRDPLEPVRGGALRQFALDRELGLAVRIDRRGRVRLHDRHRGRLTVDGAGRGKHEAPDPRVAHGVEHGQRADHVVLVIRLRPADRFADVEPGRKMHHGIGPMVGEHAAHGVAVVHGTLRQRHATRHRFGVARREVVDHRDRMAGIDERAHRVAADVARAAGDDYPRHVSATD